MRGDRRALWRRWPSFLSWATVVSAFSSYATAEVRILRSDVAEDIRHPLHINRNGQVLAQYGAGELNHFVYANGGGIIGESSLPRGHSVFDLAFSNWGFAATIESDLDGLFAGAIGEEIQFVARPPGGGGNFGPLDLNDRGTVAWLARDSNLHGLDRIYTWREGSLPRLLPNPTPTELDRYSVAVVAPDDSIYAGYIVPGAFRWSSYSEGSGWTIGGNQPAHPFGTVTQVNLLGQTAFKGQRPDGNRYDIYIAQGQTLTYVMDATELGMTPHQRPTDLTLADEGSLLVRMGPALSDGEWSATLRRPAGSLLDLQTLLPSGFSEPLRPGVALSYDGSKVLLEGRRNTDGSYSYFVYDGVELLPVLEGLTERIQSPRISDDGGVFFYLKEPSGRYSLAYASVPEPGGVMVLAIAGVVVATARRARRAPWSTSRPARRRSSTS